MISAVDAIDLRGRKYYHCSEPKDVKFDFKIKRKAHFFNKYLVWQIFYDKGNILESIITDCLQKR